MTINHMTDDDKARILLVMPTELLDRVRVLAGRETTVLKLPVSVQIVLRTLIEEGLKREHHRRLRASIAGHARAVRRIRSQASRRSDRIAKGGRRRRT